MTEFYVGQKVWSKDFGEGVVERTYLGVAIPIVLVVKFDEGTALCFTSDGRYYAVGDVVLFPYPVEGARDDESTEASLDWKDSLVERPKGEPT